MWKQKKNNTVTFNREYFFMENICGFKSVGNFSFWRYYQLFFLQGAINLVLILCFWKNFVLLFPVKMIEKNPKHF